MKYQSRRSFFPRIDYDSFDESHTVEDFHDYRKVDEEYVSTHIRHEEYEREWVDGGRGQPPVEVLMGKDIKPRPGNQGGLNFGGTYLWRHGNNFSDFRDFMYSEEHKEGSDGRRVDGLYERWVLDTLDRLKQRLTKAKPPVIETNEDQIAVRIGSNKPFCLSLRDEIFAFMHAENLAHGACRDPRVEFYTNLLAPHLKELQATHPVKWVKARTEYMMGYVTEMCLLRDFPVSAAVGSLEHVAPLACNTAPHGHLNKRRFKRTPDAEPWLKLAQSWDGASAPAMLAFTLKCREFLDINWFTGSNEEPTTPTRESFKGLRILIDNGLDVDKLSDLYLKIAQTKGVTAQNLEYCLGLMEVFYDSDSWEGMPKWGRFKEDYEAENFMTDRFGRTANVPAWISTNQDFTKLFNGEADLTAEREGKLVLAFDDYGKSLVSDFFKLAGPEALECLNVFTSKGYQLQTVVGLPLDQAIEITHHIGVRYGIGNLGRAERVLDLLITLLPNSSGDKQQKFIKDFLAYADKQAPDSPWRNVLEGDDTSINLPGMGCLQACMLGTPEHKGQTVEDNNVTPERLALLDRWLSLPLTHRSKMKPLLRYYLNQSPLLTTQAESVLSLENLADEPRINNGLGDLFSFYEQAQQECLSMETLEYYFTFIAPRMPNPLAPPAGFLRLYEHIMHARDTEYMNEVFFENPFNGDRERAQRKQAQKTVDRQTLLADLVHLWGLDLVSYEQLETWLKWVHGSVEESECEALKVEVKQECDYLHPRHYEGLHSEVATAKLERLTAEFRREYELHSAEYDAMFEAEAEDLDQREEYDSYFIGDEEVKFSDQEPISLEWGSLQKRHEGTVETLYKSRISNLRNKRSKLSSQRLKFLEQVFPLLGLVGKNASLGSLLSEVIIDLMNSVVDLGDVDPLNSPVSKELAAVLAAVHTEVTPESYGLPEFLLDRQRLARFTREADSAWKVITVFESIRQAYKKTQEMSAEYRRKFESAMSWDGSVEDFDFEGEVIRQELNLIWKEVKEAVPTNVIDVLMSTQFNMQSLMALSTAVKGFREKALSASLPTESRFRYQRDGYKEITDNMLTLGSVGQGLASLASANSNSAERLSEVQIMTAADTNLPTFFRPDFKTDPAQMEAAFMKAYPHFKTQVRQWREADFGLLPGGAKVHVIKPFDSSHVEVVKNIFGLDQTSFQLIHADQSLILPPVPSSEELKHMLLLLEHLGIFKGGIDPELQITVPGRLEDPESLAILGSSVILASSRNYEYREEAFGTSHNDQTASRMLAYDAGARNSALPMMFGLEGRTDILGRFDPDDISNYRLIASVLMQREKGVGPYQDLAERFRKDYIEQVLKPHGLEFVLKTPWIHPHDSWKSGSPEENKAHYQAVNACVNQYFVDAQTAIDTGELGCAVWRTHKLVTQLAKRFRAERAKIWVDPKYETDREQLFENL